MSTSSDPKIYKLKKDWTIFVKMYNVYGSGPYDYTDNEKVTFKKGAKFRKDSSKSTGSDGGRLRFDEIKSNKKYAMIIISNDYQYGNEFEKAVDSGILIASK